MSVYKCIGQVCKKIVIDSFQKKNLSKRRKRTKGKEQKEKNNVKDLFNITVILSEEADNFFKSILF